MCQYKLVYITAFQEAVDEVHRLVDVDIYTKTKNLSLCFEIVQMWGKVSLIGEIRQTQNYNLLVFNIV